MERYDTAVIGGGLLGCFAARELSRFKLDIALIEAREDVCTGISRANTAIVYPGYDHKPGTLKAAMCVRANTSFEELCEELDVPFSRCGSLMLSFGENADKVLRQKLRQGEQNGVPGLHLLNADEVLRLEPEITHEVCSALFSETAGTVNPWQLGIAACENAKHNGVQLMLNTRLTALSETVGGYVLETSAGEIFARSLINCAGLEACTVHEMLFPTSVNIRLDAGDYLIIDKAADHKPVHILQYEPEEHSKGLTIVPTVDGSLLIGPTERNQTVPYATTAEGLCRIRETAAKLLPALSLDETIRSFAAVRPNPKRAGEDIKSFCIEHPAPRFWSLIGIKTPGMTCAQELGRHVAEKLAAELEAEPDPGFDPFRKAIIRAHTLSCSGRKALVEKEPEYGEIICFCEDVTKAEVLEAIRRGAVSVDGVKRRAGTGMGRCQGSRCQQKIVSILSAELGISESAILKDGPGSEIVGQYGTL